MESEITCERKKRYFLGGTEEKYEKYQPGSFVLEPLFEFEDPNLKLERYNLVPEISGASLNQLVATN
jgi:hypothetical protein